MNDIISRISTKEVLTDQFNTDRIKLFRSIQWTTTYFLYPLVLANNAERRGLWDGVFVSQFHPKKKDGNDDGTKWPINQHYLKGYKTKKG